VLNHKLFRIQEDAKKRDVGHYTLRDRLILYICDGRGWFPGFFSNYFETGW